jgi:hypothetical protein
MSANPTIPIQSNTAARPVRKKMHWLIRWSLIISVILGTVVIFLIWLLAFGAVGGMEISPDDFTARRFFYREFPLFHWQYSPIYREDETSSAVLSMRGSGFINSAPDTQRWDLISDNNIGSDSLDCQASLLQEILSWEDEKNSPFWTRWNQSNPEKAKLFWPRMQELAKRRGYVIMPGLAALAANTKSDVAQLEKQLDQKLREEYLAFARNALAAEKPELATGLLQGAEQYQADAAEISLLRQQLDGDQQAASRYVPPVSVPASNTNAASTPHVEDPSQQAESESKSTPTPKDQD